MRAAILDVVAYRGWELCELNVRTNHVHVVIAAPEAPQRIWNTFKARLTRRLREAGLVGSAIKPWAEGGSGRYLWTPEQVTDACRYVLDGQGADL